MRKLAVYKGKKNGFWIEYDPSENVLSEELHIKARGLYKNGEKSAYGMNVIITVRLKKKDHIRKIKKQVAGLF